jgi:transposase
LGISKNKIVGSELIKGSYNTNKFNKYIENKIINNMDNEAILMDGASIHKSVHLKEKLNNKNIARIINVPYSPQFNPIEKVFNVLKSYIRKNIVNTHKQLVNCIKKIEKMMNKKGFEKYFDNSYQILESSVR